ncbi:hypothetical protein MHM89_07780 [Pseudoalteromonas sp. CNC9-20]|nr:hypothetical protein [Pseudoalteromonas sp. CNC9-20]MCG7569826.1 hypothetical protein [Pseudoalteromonas sp. CNC9-20]
MTSSNKGKEQMHQNKKLEEAAVRHKALREMEALAESHLKDFFGEEL